MYLRDISASVGLRMSSEGLRGRGSLALSGHSIRRHSRRKCFDGLSYVLRLLDHLPWSCLDVSLVSVQVRWGRLGLGHDFRHMWQNWGILDVDVLPTL